MAVDPILENLTTAEQQLHDAMRLRGLTQQTAVETIVKAHANVLAALRFYRVTLQDSGERTVTID